MLLVEAQCAHRKHSYLETGVIPLVRSLNDCASVVTLLSPTVERALEMLHLELSEMKVEAVVVAFLTFPKKGLRLGPPSWRC